VFSICRSQRAVDGLMIGLSDPRFEVRFHCGRSLAVITTAAADLHVDSARVLDVVKQEATVSRRVWESRRLLDGVERDEIDPFVDELITHRANQSMAHVFTILSLVLPRAPLRVAFHALHTDDTRLRGTALEYLELTLPPAIHQRLAPFLDNTAVARTGRTRDAVLSELLLSQDSVLANLSELRRRTAAPAQVGQ
jgi:hypothetical protein